VYIGFWFVKVERKRQRGRPKCRCENKIKMDAKEIVCEVMDWINMPRKGISYGLLIKNSNCFWFRKTEEEMLDYLRN
jgi:hypothetical protein